jgi:hypothetical protein
VDSTVSATIVSAFYGTDTAGSPKPASVAKDGQSLSITVLSGLTPLSVTMISPDPDNPILQLCQGATVLARTQITNHTAISTIIVHGT